jgi:hypothetical protein
MTICQQIDKDGVDKRKGKKLIRRKYHNKGPNYVWHMDGYDKLNLLVLKYTAAFMDTLGRLCGLE